MIQSRAVMEMPSYYHNPRITPYQYKTIPACLEEWANERPDKPAVIVRFDDKPRQQLTFSELYKTDNSFVNGLWNLGVRKGSKVALFIRNSIEWIIGFNGIVMTGAIAVTAMSFHPDTCLSSASQTGCDLIVLDARHLSGKEELDTFVDALKRGAAEEHFDMGKIILVQGSMKSKSMLDFEEMLMEKHRLFPVDTDLDPDDFCLMMPTSGSSGKSKYILHSHFAAINGSMTVVKVAGLSEKDIFFSDRPMGYTGGFPHYLVSCGATHLYIETHTTGTPESIGFILDVLEEEKATSGLFMPYLLFDMLKYTGSRNTTPRLERAFIGGQMIDRSTLEDLFRFVEEPIFAYAMSESFGHFMLPRQRLVLRDETRLGGFPSEGIEVKIVDDRSHVVPVGNIGEICLRSRYICREYFRSPEMSESALDLKSWYHTEDMGTLREDGYLIIEGRKKEMIKRGTAKIYPAAVETRLKEHPSVDEVFVFGVPDDRLFEEVCACVVPSRQCSLTENDIRVFSNRLFQPELSPDGRGLMPGYFKIMENIPRLATNKVDRIKLKQICTKLNM